MDAMSTQEAAAMAGVTVETIRRWVRSGLLPVRRIGRVCLINERDLRAVMANPPKPTGRPRRPTA